MDIGIEASNILGDEPDVDEDGLFSVKRATIEARGGVYSDEEMSDGSDNDLRSSDEQSQLSFYDSEEEAAQKVYGLEADMDSLFEDFKNRQMEKDPAGRTRADKRQLKREEKGSLKEQFEEWYGIEYDKRKPATASSKDDEGAADSDEDVLITDSESENEALSGRARTFFDNPVFKTLKQRGSSEGLFDTEREVSSEDEDSDEEIRKMNSRERVQNDDADAKDIEFVPAMDVTPHEDFSDDEFVIKTAKDYTLAQKLISASGRRDLIDDSYNRYVFNDTDELPTWFIQDEQKHNQLNIPVTKEAVKIMQERAKQLDARPIKKVAEAKFRKQFRAARRAEKFKNQADAVAEDEDMPDGAKAKNIVKLMSKANAKKKDKLPSLVVAKGSARGLKGRPKGVKGKYKMVDPRMKKELRADKRVKKSQKKRRR